LIARRYREPGSRLLGVAGLRQQLAGSPNETPTKFPSEPRFVLSVGTACEFKANTKYESCSGPPTKQLASQAR
jgi:hypothetical protein